MPRYSYEIHCPSGEIIEGVECDEIFDTKEEANDAASYSLSCISIGREALYMSNPGDYEYDEDEDYDDYKIVIIKVE